MLNDGRKAPANLLEQAGNRAEGDVDRKVRRRFFPNVRDGVLVEVGAARPDYLSISNLYRTVGWHVLAIDPNPAYFEYYEKYGLELLPYAVDNKDEDNVDFVVVDSHGQTYKNGGVSFESWSSLAIKEEYSTLRSDLDVKKIKVKVRRLDSIMRDHAPDVRSIDIVAVDVEGWELEVLSSLSFEKFRPKVLIVENLFLASKYRAFMAERGYDLWRCIPPNDVFVRSDLMGPVERKMGSLQSTFVTARAQVEGAISGLRRALSAR